MWKRLLCGCFAEEQNLKIYGQMLAIMTMFIICIISITGIQQDHSVNLKLERLSNIGLCENGEKIYFWIELSVFNWMISIEIPIISTGKVVLNLLKRTQWSRRSNERLNIVFIRRRLDNYFFQKSFKK